MTHLWWSLAFLAPLVAAVVRVVMPRVSRPTRGRDVALATCAVASLLPAGLLTILPGVVTAPATHFDWVLTGLSFRMDLVARALTLVTVVLYAVALAAVTRRNTARAGELSALLLLCLVGNVAVLTAADVVTFYLGFALMSYAAFGLVISTRTPDARRAALVYLVLVVVSETFTLAALMLVAGAGGMQVEAAAGAVAASGQRDLIIALLLVGFGTKAGLVPLHVWLPLAHPAAPPAASAVLSGAMVKAGVVGWIRFLPLGEAAAPAAGLVMVVLGAIGAFGSVVVGVQQRDPKTVLAYSTVSQLGYLTIVVGVALARPELAAASVTAALIYAVHHGLAKGAAFLGVSVWRHRATRWRARMIALGMLIASLAIVGAPLSSGSVGKYATKSAIDGVVVLGLDLVSLLPWVATGSTLLLLRVATLLSREEPRDAREPLDIEFVAWAGLVALCIPLPWLVAERWIPLADVPDLEPVVLWDATWPVLVGLALAAVAWGARHGLRRVPQVPAGDLVLMAEHVDRGAIPRAGVLEVAPAGLRPPVTRQTLSAALGRGEAAFGGWPLAVGSLVVLTVVLILGGG